MTPVVRDGLGHCSVAVTQVYLPTSRTRMEEMIRRNDWTRSSKNGAKAKPDASGAAGLAAKRPQATGDLAA